MFLDSARSRLAALEREHLLRTPRTLAAPTGPTALIEGRERIVLCSNDYLGLAGHPKLREALAAGAMTWGSSASASPQVSGTLRVHEEAAEAIAAFMKQPAALLFPSGTAANHGAISALVGPGDIVFSDALNHASIIDGCRLSRARVVVYPHADTRALDALLRAHRHEGATALIVTDAVFSMDGDTTDLKALARVASRWDAGLLVDEAHALGVVGPGGRGFAAACGVHPDLVVGTFGKAFGLAGAFAAGPAELIAVIANRARSYVFSTAMLPALAAAIPSSIELVRGADDARARLELASATLRQELSALGFQIPPGRSAIVPMLLGAPERAMQFSTRLFDLDVFVHGIRPPTVPIGTSRLRIVPTAAHTEAHLERVLAAFSALAQADELRPIDDPRMRVSLANRLDEDLECGLGRGSGR